MRKPTIKMNSIAKRILSALMIACCMLSVASCSAEQGQERETTTESRESKETETSADAETTAEPVDNRERVKVIILSGQSNAVGHTAFSCLDLQTMKKYSSGFSNIYVKCCVNPYIEGETMVIDGFVRARPGMGRANGNNFGPELGMAEVLSQAFPEENIFIIKDATGGSSLGGDWMPDNGKQSKLLSHLLSFVDEGLKELENQNLAPEIIGFCWMQGESDSGYEAARNTYNQKFDRLVKTIEEEFSEYLPEQGMAVVQAGISTYWTEYVKMNEIKKQYTEEHPNAYYFDTIDLTYDQDNGDHAHFDAAAMAELGRRFGNVIIESLE